MQPSSTTKRAWAALPAALAALAAQAALAQSATTTSALAFGRFAPGSGGTVVIRANGSRTATGGVTLLPSTASAAGFMVDGTQQVIVTLPANGSLALTNGTASMAVTNFTSSRPNGTLNPGKQPLSVGATLQVAPNQRGGAYSGELHVILEYQ